jgi:YegS/Rv2252/BmrU family lipid kinase
MTDPRPFYFIINPNAGIGIRGFAPVATRLKELNVPYFAAATTGSGDARMLAQLARQGDFRAIVCHGGDGTMNEIVNGLATAGGTLDGDVTLGLIPSGTAQDIARGLDLPRARMAALDRLLDGKETTVDVGRIRFADGRLHFFVNNVGVGFDAEVAERAQDVRGAITSFPAHVFGFASTLAVYRNKTITLAIEGRDDTLTRVRCNTVLAANGPSYGGVMKLAPTALMDDGLLDLVVIGDVDKLELLLNLPRAFAGTHLGHNKVAFERARAFTLESEDEARVQADGEVIGRLPVRVDVLPRALRLIR